MAEHGFDPDTQTIGFKVIPCTAPDCTNSIRPHRETCSPECEHVHRQYRAELFEGLSDGELRKPDVEAIREGVKRSDRWTPTRMRERIEAFKRQLQRQ